MDRSSKKKKKKKNQQGNSGSQGYIGPAESNRHIHNVPS